MLQRDKISLYLTIFHFANVTEITKWESGRILPRFLHINIWYICMARIIQIKQLK
jgi:hypothetical protein